MSFLGELVSNLKQQWQTAKDQAQARRELEQALVQAISDGRLTSSELGDLWERLEELGLDERSWQRLQPRLYALAIRAVTADRRLTADEEQALQQLADHFGIPEQVRSYHARELARYRLLAELENGHLPEVEPAGMALQRGEVAHWVEPAELLEERVVKRQYEGGSSGFSFRVAKGVYYHVGGHGGRVITETGIVPVSRGDLVITNKRIVFRGDRKNFATPWQKVIDLDMYQNGLRISRDGSQKPAMLRFLSNENTEIIGMICSVVLNQYGG